MSRFQPYFFGFRGVVARGVVGLALLLPLFVGCAGRREVCKGADGAASRPATEGATERGAGRLPPAPAGQGVAGEGTTEERALFAALGVPVPERRVGVAVEGEGELRLYLQGAAGLLPMMRLPLAEFVARTSGSEGPGGAWVLFGGRWPVALFLGEDCVFVAWDPVQRKAMMRTDCSEEDRLAAAGISAAAQEPEHSLELALQGAPADATASVSLSLDLDGQPGAEELTLDGGGLTVTAAGGGQLEALSCASTADGLHHTKASAAVARTAAGDRSVELHCDDRVQGDGENSESVQRAAALRWLPGDGEPDLVHVSERGESASHCGACCDDSQTDSLELEANYFLPDGTLHWTYTFRHTDLSDYSASPAPDPSSPPDDEPIDPNDPSPPDGAEPIDPNDPSPPDGAEPPCEAVERVAEEAQWRWTWSARGEDGEEVVLAEGDYTLEEPPVGGEEESEGGEEGGKDDEGEGAEGEGGAEGGAEG